MATTLFTIPLKSGKKEAYRDFLNEIFGPKRKEYEDLLRRYGLNNVKIWLHTLDGTDYVLIIHEMDDDTEKLVEAWSASTHPFDHWMDQHIRDCYDVEDLNNMPEQPTFFAELDLRRN